MFFLFHISQQLRSARTSSGPFISPLSRVNTVRWYHSISLHPSTRALSSLCEQQILRTVIRILQDFSQALFPEFEWLSSGSRYLGCRTQRRATFAPRPFISSTYRIPYLHASLHICTIFIFNLFVLLIQLPWAF